MSDIFPKLQGEDVAIWKQPEFKTNIFDPMSGIEARTSRRYYAKWTFGVPIQFLVDKSYNSDLLTILTFFLAQKGAGNSFLYTDSQGWSADNAVIGQYVGTGNGIQTQFQLQRTWAGVTEPVNNVNGTTSVFIDGILSSDYTVSDTGLITFGTAPTTAEIITWSGAYYYRVRFLDDKYKFVQASGIHHSCEDLQFIGSVRNIV